MEDVMAKLSHGYLSDIWRKNRRNGWEGEWGGS